VPGGTPGPLPCESHEVVPSTAGHPAIGEEEVGQEEGDDRSALSTHGRRRGARASQLIERYASARGYQKETESGRYTHPDGSWLQRSDSRIFHWEEYSAEGRLLQSYWLREHCLQESPVKLDAAVWGLCQRHPEQYTLILVDTDDRPLELNGRELLRLRDSGVLKLYPAEYRIAWEE